jgi:predicted transcriptional regulator
MALGANKHSYNIILDIAVKNEIDRIADEEMRSSSNLINLILKQYIESREGGE